VQVARRKSMLMRSLMLGLVLITSSAAGAEPVMGRDYVLVQPAQPPDARDTIEVIQFFSYGCPHCAAMHERVSEWSADLPAGVVYKRVPVGFGRPAWINLARTYYALEAIGELERIDGALYEALHEQHLSLVDEKSIAAWLEEQGVDAAKFSAAFNSFSVETRLARAEALTRSYRIAAVPTFTVAGEFAVLGRSEAQVIATTDALVAKVRSGTTAAGR
jgi:thiol:disulfide interchange protein DsbA